jgi:hypothetical protein
LRETAPRRVELGRGNKHDRGKPQRQQVIGALLMAPVLACPVISGQIVRRAVKKWRSGTESWLDLLPE